MFQYRQSIFCAATLHQCPYERSKSIITDRTQWSGKAETATEEKKPKLEDSPGDATKRRREKRE